MEGVAATDLARSMRLVKQHARPTGSLVRISRLSTEDQRFREQQHIDESLNWIKPILIDA
jgi:hypothetical protein